MALFVDVINAHLLMRPGTPWRLHEFTGWIVLNGCVGVSQAWARGVFGVCLEVRVTTYDKLRRWRVG